MISGQMYEMERNEISVLKSRGASGGSDYAPVPVPKHYLQGQVVYLDCHLAGHSVRCLGRPMTSFDSKRQENWKYITMLRYGFMHWFLFCNL